MTVNLYFFVELNQLIECFNANGPKCSSSQALNLSSQHALSEAIKSKFVVSVSLLAV